MRHNATEPPAPNSNRAQKMNLLLGFVQQFDFVLLRALVMFRDLVHLVAGGPLSGDTFVTFAHTQL